MITGLTIRRFQSFAEQHLEFGKLTVIVGPSNTGKSAIGRAMRVVTRNAFSAGYVRVGAKDAEVTLHLSDADISANRGAALSTFTITPTGSAPEVYAKSGVTVPQPVQDRLQTPAGMIEMFYTTQFDSPFLLATTGSSTATVLGELSSATMLSSAVREAARRRTAAVADAKFQTTSATDGEAQVRDLYATLPARRAAVASAHLVRATLANTLAEADTLLSAVNRVTQHTATVSTLTAGIGPRVVALTQAETLLSSATAALGEQQTLTQAAQTLVSASDTVVSLAAVSLREQATAALAPLFSDISTLTQTSDALTNTLAGLTAAAQRVESLTAAVAGHTAAVSAAQTALSEAFAQAEVCPLCAQTLTGLSAPGHGQEQPC